MRQTKAHPLYRLLILSAAFLLLFVSGCAGVGRWTWQHPEELGIIALQQDKNECRILAENRVKDVYYYRHFYTSFYYDRYYRNNPFRYFYPRHDYYDFHRYNNNLEKLYRFCLQVKGWRQVNVGRSR